MTLIKIKKYVRGRIISCPDVYPKYVKYLLKDGSLKVLSESIITDINGMMDPILIKSNIAVKNVAKVIEIS